MAPPHPHSGLGPRTARRLLAAFGLPDAVFSAGLPALLQVVPEPLARELAQAPAPTSMPRWTPAEHWLAASTDHALLTLADPEYPQALLTTRTRRPCCSRSAGSNC